MKKNILFVFLFWLLLTTAWCSKKQNAENEVWMANPASVYCEENGWNLEIIFDYWESYWICHFPNWSSCEEREYFRWECWPKEFSGEINNFQSCVDAWYPILESYPRQCKTPDKRSFTEQIETSWEVLNTNTWENTICPMDAKQCPDWSYVSRKSPNCEFEDCPNKSENLEDNWVDTNNEEVEDEKIKEIFESHKSKDSFDSSWLTEDDIDLMEDLIEELK